MNNRHSMLARCLSLILSLLILLSMMPTLAIAEEGADAPQAQQEQTEKASEPAPEPEPEPTPEPEPAPAPEPEPAPAEEASAPAEDTAPAADNADVSDSQEQAAAPAEVIEEKPEEKKEEEEYPAQTLTANAGGVKVTLKAPEGALPMGSKLKAHQVGQQYINAVENTLEAQGRSLSDAVAIDVTPVNKDGKEIQPKKSVKVTFSGTGLDLEAGDEVDVFRVSDDASTVTDMNGSGGANSQTFSTNHFTIYVSSGSQQDPNGDGTN